MKLQISIDFDEKTIDPDDVVTIISQHLDRYYDAPEVELLATTIHGLTETKPKKLYTQAEVDAMISRTR